MKKQLLLIPAALALGVAIGTTAYAQGRHDEKAHGAPAPKSAQEKKDTARATTSGRHDEGMTTHGPKKAKAKKDDADKK